MHRSPRNPTIRIPDRYDIGESMVHGVQCGGLTLITRVLDESALWAWEILETTTGRFVDSSWSSEWMAYDSRSEAEAAGLRRLAELATRERPRVA
jgi:hypothetical protein